MSTPTIWSAGRYEAVAEHIAPIAAQMIDALDRRIPLRDAAVVDLACGTGSAALAAAARGARVTAVDITAELIATAAQKAQSTVPSIAWVTADASATALPAQSFDVAVSNMGIIFVEPAAQVAEIERLLKPGATLTFSSWVHDKNNPFFNPIVDVLGPPPASDYTPDQWAQREIIDARLSSGFTDVSVESGFHTWRYRSLDVAMNFVAHESPMHVCVLSNADPARRGPLLAAFEAALRAHVRPDGGVSFDSPYVVVSARRR